MGSNPTCGVEVTLKSLFGFYYFAWTALTPDVGPSFLQKLLLRMRPQDIFPCWPWNICPLSALCITLILSAPPFYFLSLFLIYRDNFSSFSAFMLIYFCPPLHPPQVLIEQMNIQPFAFSLSLTLAALNLLRAPRGLSSPACSFWLGCLFFLSLSDITCAIWHPSPPLHTLKSKWKLGCFVLIAHLIAISKRLQLSAGCFWPRWSSYYWSCGCSFHVIFSTWWLCATFGVFPVTFPIYPFPAHTYNWDCDCVYSCTYVPWHFPAICLRSAVVYLKSHPEYLI